MSCRSKLGSLAQCVLGVTLAASLGCAKVNSMAAAGTGGVTGSGTGGATGASGSTGAAGTTATTGTAGTTGSGTDAGGDAACIPSVSCTPAGGQYCGKIGNGCKGGSLDCAPCAGDGVCSFGLCVGGPSCRPLTCASGGAVNYCGVIGDGCGMKVDCGACGTGQVCKSGICASASCVPLTCASGSTRYCGTIGDGCGGTLACGDCAAGSTCGGGGVPGVCAATNCTPVTCMPKGGGQYCGRIGNGCGGVLDCPACPGGMACGTGAQAGVCPGVPTTGGGCTGLACQINKCTGMPKTTVKGTVYDPGGKLPLYNVMVYVPNAPLDSLVEGVSCDKCGTIASGQPVASALTDASGNFTMPDVPVGANIPVVIQTGKWRRQITLPTVKACQDNTFPGTDTFRLPKNQSEGHLPKIAMTRGKADSLECLLRRIGVSDSEFTNPDGAGRVNIYYETSNCKNDDCVTNPGSTRYDSGTTFPLVSTLFNQTVINKYDMMVISCHGESARSRAQPLAEKQIVKNFVDAGGRVFGSHFSFGYFRGVPGTTDAKNFQPTPWPLLAMWDGNSDPPYTIDTSFAKGNAFADWLVAVGASPTRGQIAMTGVEGPAMSLTPGFGSQQWINSVGGIPYLSVPMPVEKASTPADQCGRFVNTGIHVATSGNGGPFPSSCGTDPLTPQEKAWEFLIFELGACALPDNQMPTPPVVPPPGAPTSPPPAATPPPAPPPPPPPPPPPMVD
jgi:hypothetical protein